MATEEAHSSARRRISNLSDSVLRVDDQAAWDAVAGRTAGAMEAIKTGKTEGGGVYVRMMGSKRTDEFDCEWAFVGNCQSDD